MLINMFGAFNYGNFTLTLPFVQYIICPMKKNLLLSCCCLLLISTFAQYNPEKINKKAVAIYGQALERAQESNYTHAICLLLQSIETDKKYVDAYLSLGGVYGQMKNYRASVEYYEKAFAIDPDYTMEYKLP